MANDVHVQSTAAGQIEFDPFEENPCTEEMIGPVGIEVLVQRTNQRSTFVDHLCRFDARAKASESMCHADATRYLTCRYS